MTDVDELESLPKVELHVHLEGSISLETAIALARRHGDDPAAVLPLVDGGYPPRYDDFLGFVDLYLALSRLIRTPDDLAEVAAAFVREQTRQNVRWSEVTFTALTHVNNGMEPAALWAALRDGLAAGGAAAEVGVIVDAVRNLGVEHAEATVRLVAEADAPIVGLGLAGVETVQPAADFRVLRTAADRLGLGLAVHAGETGSATQVSEAIDHLGADRIGHGVAAADDAEIVARLVRDQVPLEVCPTSNVALGVASALDAHPFAGLWSAGVNVTVNSDDPALFATTLTDELRHARRLARLERADLAELQRRAARAAFVTPRVRARLLAEIDRWADAPA